MGCGLNAWGSGLVVEGSEILEVNSQRRMGPLHQQHWKPSRAVRC